MKKRILTLFASLIIFIIQPVAAQPEDPFVTPLPGKLTFWSNEGFILIDTITGEWNAIEGAGGYATWDPTGQILASVLDETNTSIMIDTNILKTISQSFDSSLRNTNDTELQQHRKIAGWSADGEEVMYLTQSAVVRTTTNARSSYNLEIMNISTGVIRIVFEIPIRAPFTPTFSAPEDSKDVFLDFIDEARWNPIYTDWVILEPVGTGIRTSTGERIGVYEAGLYNYVTQEYISLSTVVPYTVISFSNWSADGRKIAMNTMAGVDIVSFDVQEGRPILKHIGDAIQTHGQAVIQWAGAGDILVTATTHPYRTSFIGQAINDRWYSQEFVALAALTPKFAGGTRDFYLTATGDERNRISCMFLDQARPPHLLPNQRGQVTFTDGTPSRLRATPSTQGEVIAQMQEGTSFETVGDAYCVDDYRWWQVRLDDGTTGWAAEGSQSEFWIEPIN